jgi:ribosomal-protein-alanine N-acetyltransferase
MEPTPPILTARLELRPLRYDDAGALLSFRGHPEAVRYLSHEALTPEKTRRLLTDLMSRADDSTPGWFHVGWAVVLRSTGAVIGDGRTWNTPEPPLPGSIPAHQASIGYLLHPDYHGMGYGREAAAALVHWLFTRRGCAGVYAGVYEPNVASRRLLESLGFVPDHYFRAEEDSHGKGLPSWRYRLDRPVWKAAREGPSCGHNSTTDGPRR